MLSSDYETKIKINKKEFLDCIDRATLLVREGEKKPIIIEITDNSMELRIDSAMGSMNENIDIDKALEQSGLVMVETSNDKVQSWQPESIASEVVPRPRRKRPAPVVASDEPLMMVETQK